MKLHKDIDKEIDKLEKEIRRLKDWIQTWVINKETGKSWKEFMEKELYGK